MKQGMEGAAQKHGAENPPHEREKDISGISLIEEVSDETKTKERESSPEVSTSKDEFDPVLNALLERLPEKKREGYRRSFMLIYEPYLRAKEKVKETKAEIEKLAELLREAPGQRAALQERLNTLSVLAEQAKERLPKLGTALETEHMPLASRIVEQMKQSRRREAEDVIKLMEKTTQQLEELDRSIPAAREALEKKAQSLQGQQSIVEAFSRSSKDTIKDIHRELNKQWEGRESRTSSPPEAA